jgi:hypothetical protein
MMRAVHGRGLIDQLVKRQVEQRRDFFARPVGYEHLPLISSRGASSRQNAEHGGMLWPSRRKHEAHRPDARQRHLLPGP